MPHPGTLLFLNSDLFKEFLESDKNGVPLNGGDEDDSLSGLTAYDRAQERIKMEKLAELAKLCVN
jgi:hypothetical protein